MSRRVHTLWAILTSTMLCLTGCHPTQPFYFFEDGDLSHYVDKATSIDYPDAQTTSLADVENATAPLTLENTQPKEMWDLTLEEAVKLSLANSKVMRSLGGRFSSSAFNNRAQTGEAPDAIVSSPDNSRSVYDPAIIETQPFFGVEQALAAFDTQLSSNLFYNMNDRPQNVRNLASANGQSFFTPIFQQETSTFNAQLSKTTAQGGTFSVRNNTIYDFNNNPTRQVPRDYNVNYEVAFSQPLLAASGTQFNRIAGPAPNPFGGVFNPNASAAFDGVMLARINTDISLADFEGGVRNLVSDVENAYWELYFAYRNLEASKSGRASALQTWKKIHALYQAGSRGGEAEKEAQSREQYFLFRAQVQTALNDLYRSENRLRYVMGLAVADGRLIRPADEPTTAKVNFDWCEIHAEGLSRSVELRRQKWRLKERELEIIAARNLLQPRLDASGTYRWLGLGNNLIDSNRQMVPINPAIPLQGTNAYQNLTSGQFSEWQLGAQFNMPLGFRRELATIRHYELQLARERARLQDEELEVSHQLGDALRNLEYNYNLTQTNFNRRVAAEKQVEAVEAAYLAETVTLDLLLDAQRRRADAEIAYYRTLSDYNRGIVQVHYRKGSLLEYNGVYLSEGPWPAKAQFDAHRLARQRDASFYLDYGFTRPRVISQGAYHQIERSPGSSVESMPSDGETNEATPENVPAPTPATRSPGRSLDTSEPTARHAAAGGLRQPKLRAAAAGDSFDWGSLGMEGVQPAVAGRSAERNPAAASFERGQAVRQNVPRPGAISTAEPADDEVQQAGYQQWKSSTKHEPLANTPPRSADRTASGWQGAKR